MSAFATQVWPGMGNHNDTTYANTGTRNKLSLTASAPNAVKQHTLNTSGKHGDLTTFSSGPGSVSYTSQSHKSDSRLYSGDDVNNIPIAEAKHRVIGTGFRVRLNLPGQGIERTKDGSGDWEDVKDESYWRTFSFQDVSSYSTSRKLSWSVDSREKVAGPNGRDYVLSDVQSGEILAALDKGWPDRKTDGTLTWFVTFSQEQEVRALVVLFQAIEVIRKKHPVSGSLLGDMIGTGISSQV